MEGGEPHVLAPVGPRVPPWDLLPICNLLVKNTGRTSKDMKIKELGLWKPGLVEDITR